MKHLRKRNPVARLNDMAVRAMREAVEDVVQTHRRLGLPLVVWRDGKAVLVSPEKLAVVRENPAHYRTRGKGQTRTHS